MLLARVAEQALPLQRTLQTLELFMKIILWIIGIIFLIGLFVVLGLGKLIF